MSQDDRKKEEPSWIPPQFAKGAALFAGGFAGYQAGKGIADYTIHKLDIPDDIADRFETGAEVLGALFVGAASIGLARQNPEKSVITGAKALGTMAFVAGAGYTAQKLNEVAGKIDDLSAEVADIKSGLSKGSPYEIQSGELDSRSPYALANNSTRIEVEGSGDIPFSSPYQAADDTSQRLHPHFSSATEVTTLSGVMDYSSLPLFSSGSEPNYLNIHGNPPTDIHGNPTGRTIHGTQPPTIYGTSPVDGYGNPVYNSAEGTDGFGEKAYGDDGPNFG